MIYALGSLSGAHLNPAVTVAVLLCGRGRISTIEAVVYLVAQVLGGICGGAAYSGIVHKAVHFGPNPGFGWAQAGTAELLFTFILCFVVLNVATTRLSSKDFFGLAIGSCVIVGGYAVGPISGACLNPAVAIGLDSAAVLHGAKLELAGLPYSFFEILGGCLAAGAFFGIRPSEFRPEKMAPARSASRMQDSGYGGV